MAEDKIFRTKIIMTWEDQVGNDNGEMVVANHNTTRQGRLAMQEALTAEILRWGKTALRAHGLEPLPMEFDADNSPAPKTK